MHRSTFRAIVVALSLAASAFGVAACGSSSDDSGSGSSSSSASSAPQGKKIKVGLVTDIGGLNDRSFNQLANDGLERAEKDLGVDGRVLTSDENSDYILGSEGTCTIGRGPRPRIEGKTEWTWTGQPYDMYQREHDVLFASLRKGKPATAGKRLATSTMLAIMGRMAAYTGQQITWDQALNSTESLVPPTLDWKNGKLDIRPIARPGITKFA